MPDGGMPYRCHNPIGINPFLSFLNLKEIRKVYDVDSVKSTEYCESLNKFLPQDLMKDGYPWELDNFEDSNKKAAPYGGLRNEAYSIQYHTGR